MGSKHANKDSKTDLLIELFKEGKTDGEIHEITGLDTNWIDFVLKREGLRQKSSQYTAKITPEVASKILEMQEQGKTGTEIAREVGLTDAGVRAFLKRKGLEPNKAGKLNRSRPCQGPGCTNWFTPKYSDGPAMDKYKACSPKCANALTAQAKIKYTQEDIDKVIELKKQGITNNEISARTGVKLDKIKRIVKENGLKLSSDIRIRNARAGQMEQRAANPPRISKNARSEEALENLKSELMERGYEYVSGFITKTKPFVIKHLKCENQRTASRIYTVVKGKCEYCNAKDSESAGEKELRDWFKELGHKGDKYYFNKGKKGSEIDVCSTDAKFGVEYCGLYWHSNWGNPKNPTNRHKIKLDKAESRGIRLITLFEDEWQTRKEQVKSFIATFLMAGDHSNIFNKSVLKIISKEVSGVFLLKNYHTIDTSSGPNNFGLFCEDELIGVACYSASLSIFTVDKICLKMGLSIRQGFDHIMQLLIEYAKREGFKKVRYISDSRWTKGDSLSNFGFNLIEEIPPQFEYGSGSKRINPDIFTEEFFISKDAIGDTLEEKIESTGHFKIWDCGKKRWEIKI